MSHTTDRTAVEREVEEIFASLGIEPSGSDVDLVGSGVLDSLTFVELVFQIEQRFGVPIEIESLELDHLRTVERIARFVAERARAA